MKRKKSIGLNFDKLLTQTVRRARLKRRRKRISIRRPFKRQARLWDQTLVWETKTFSFYDRRDLLALLFGVNTVSIHYVNALALTKFGQVRYLQSLAAEKRRGKKSPSAFIKHLDRERVRRYKYNAVQIRNLIRAAVIGFYLKNPTIVAQIRAYALPLLQRNRKETKFLRFIRKLAKIISAARWERLGIKLEFQGRVNRWRRTKRVQAIYGLIPTVSFSSRIEYGSSQAITRKGSRAVRLWVVYNPSFNNELREALISYVAYSKLLQTIKK